MNTSIQGPAEEPAPTRDDSLFVTPDMLVDAADEGAPSGRPSLIRRVGLPVALVAAGLVGGAAVGGIASASASSADAGSSASVPGSPAGDDGGALTGGLGVPDGSRHGGPGDSRGPGSESTDQQAQSSSQNGSQLQPPSHTGTGASG